jgi:trehalose-6-phosphate synthase
MKTTACAFSSLRVVCHTTSAEESYRHNPTGHMVFPVSLRASTVEVYQQQFCKLRLWPALHEDPGSERLGSLEGSAGAPMMAAISEFCEQFARHVQRVTEAAGAASLVWFNDYSMIPVAARFQSFVQGRYPIGISIRSPVGFSQAPRFDAVTRRIFVEGITAADFVSVHRPRDVYHLLQLANDTLGPADVDWEHRIVYGPQRNTTVAAIQMGSSETHWTSVGQSTEACETVDALRCRHPGVQILLSVSRLEHHKGLDLELDVIDLLLRYFPRLRRTFVFYRVLPIFPEYAHLPPYRALQAQVQSRIAKMNAEYGDESWQPIILIAGPSLRHEELAGYYRAADVLLVLSHADGFNHVSFEAVLAKQKGDRPLGMLLSDTGSSEYLGSAYSSAAIYSRTEMALQLEKMLTREEGIRRSVHCRLRTAASRRTAEEWTRDVLGALAYCFARGNEH